MGYCSCDLPRRKYAFTRYPKGERLFTLWRSFGAVKGKMMSRD